MLTGALIGACIGIVVALISLFFEKPQYCPKCEERLRRPWFRPLEECPSCGVSLVGKRKLAGARQPRAAGSRMLTVGIVLLVAGIALPLVVLPSMLESRRVWQHQQAQVDKREAEVRDLERKNDPASRAQAEKIKGELRSYHPDAHREAFVDRLAISGVGVLLAVMGLVLVAVSFAARRAARDRYDDEGEDEDDEDE